MEDDEKEIEQERRIEKGSVEDIFYVEEGNLPNTRGGLDEESLLGRENVNGSNGEVGVPWEKISAEKKKELEAEWTAKESGYSLAEMTLPESELRRLRNLTFRTTSKMKIRGAGVTQVVVDSIKEKWKSSEIVSLKTEGASALNMRKMHEILERKTGGLVIWRSGTSISLYRGVSYELPTGKWNKQRREETSPSSLPATTTMVDDRDEQVHLPQLDQETTSVEKKDQETFQPEVEYEDEIDELLDGLGPRFMEWTGDHPLPIDADLLPGATPGYEPPFRILPYGVRSSLGPKEATALRRLARFLPPHFALGRRRQLQGLATAMVALWEKSRRGVFDGTVENMHLHWKYRELVKILVKAKTSDGVKKVALALEAESGGILVCFYGKGL